VKSHPYHRLLEYPDQKLDLQIIRGKRKTMAIHILQDDQPERIRVELRVPLRCLWYDIESFLSSRHDWIYESAVALSKLPREPVPKYTEFELHYFLGQAFPLRLFKGSGKVINENGFLDVYCQDTTCEIKVAKQLEKFYKTRSLVIFEERLQVCLSEFPIDVDPRGLRVRKMKSRWGSCSQSGEICLNTLLVQRPIEAVDFVITHELCHLVHFSHNKHFYALMDRAMPKWKDKESLLSVKTQPFQHLLF
jgi:predicted metal-dependent hydrolase